MKSHIRIAYDNLQNIETREKRLFDQISLSSGGTRRQCPVVSAQILEDEIRSMLVHTHPEEMASNYEDYLKQAQDRYDASKRVLAEWRIEQEERARAIAELFKLLTDAEKEELMLAKLAR